MPVDYNSTIQKTPWILPCWVGFIFCAITLTASHFKVLWGDEFVTFWVGQQRSFAGIWTALRSGADPNPPLMHVLNWWSTAAFGTGSVAIRLPSIFGVGLGVASAWVVVRRYASASVAAVACLALMTSRGFDYSYDARSYGLLLGFAVAALACWVLSLDGSRWWLVGMAVCLAGDLSSNYYGVMAFFPVAAGELAWCWKRRQVRWAVWLALLVGALPLAGYLTLIRGNIAEFGPHAWNKPQASMIAESYFVLVEGLFWTTAIAAAVFWLRRKNHASKLVQSVPMEVRWALGVLLLYPFLGFAIAYGGAGMISARCVIPVCAGFAIAGALLLGRVGSRRVMLWCMVFLSVYVVARELACGMLLRQQRHAFFALRDQVERVAAPDETVLVGDSLVVMPLWWYGSPALRDALRFPIDFELIHRTETDDSGEQNLWGGRHGVFPVAIDKPATMIPRGQELILVGGAEGWLARELRAEGFELTPESPVAAADGYALGGVFTPLAHPQTQVLFARPR